MSRDNQIEEMAKAVCHLNRTCDQCMTSFECKAMMYAKRFYNAGYRKASEVAAEVFTKIEHCMSLFEDDDDGYLLKKCEFEYFMRELKEEYKEEGKCPN